MIPSPVRIVGSGLLGASLGLRLRQLGARVQLEDASPASAALARDLGAGEIATEDSPAPRLVVVATPPDVSGDVVKASLDRFPEAVVTDVASVKARIVGEVAGHPGADRYAGSHPAGFGVRAYRRCCRMCSRRLMCWVLRPCCS